MSPSGIVAAPSRWSLHRSVAVTSIGSRRATPSDRCAGAGPPASRIDASRQRRGGHAPKRRSAGVIAPRRRHLLAPGAGNAPGMHPFGACRPDSGEHEADPASAASGVFSKGGFVMACDGIYVRLNSGRDLCVPLYLAAQQRRADAETDPEDDDESAVRDLIGVAAIMRIASELFDGELPDGI